MHTLDQISQRSAVLPDNLQQEVLDFIDFLFTKSNSSIQKTDVTTHRIEGLQSTNEIPLSEAEGLITGRLTNPHGHGVPVQF
jgi:hypothetical protein